MGQAAADRDLWDTRTIGGVRHTAFANSRPIRLFSSDAAGRTMGRLNIVVQSSFVPKRTSTLLASHGSAKRDISYVIWQSKKKRILFPVAF